MEAIALRLEAIALGLEAIALGLEAIALRLEAITRRLEAIALRVEKEGGLFDNWLMWRLIKLHLVHRVGKDLPSRLIKISRF